MQPNVNITTTVNQFLAGAWVDQVLRDNFFFGEVLSRTEKFRGSQEVHPRLQKIWYSFMGWLNQF